MSEFILHEKPEVGDSAEHPKYGWVQIVGRVDLAEPASNSFWLVELGGLDYRIVKDTDLRVIGVWKTNS